MRRTLRELLLLLLLGQAAPFGKVSRSAGLSQPLRYSDLEELRPQRAASSWRGAVMKAQEQQWVIKTRFQGSTAFQLTRLGVERAWDELEIIRSLQGDDHSTVWTLGLLRTTSPVKNQRVLSKASEHLKRSGAWLVSAELALWSQRWYDEATVRSLRELGLSLCCLSIEPEKSLPFTLTEWLRLNQSSEQVVRLLEKASRESDQLLVELQSKKRLTQQRKQRYGSVWLSGLSVLKGLTWLDSLDPQAEPAIQKLMNSLTELSQRFDTD